MIILSKQEVETGQIISISKSPNQMQGQDIIWAIFFVFPKVRFFNDQNGCQIKANMPLDQERLCIRDYCNRENA